MLTLDLEPILITAVVTGHYTKEGEVMRERQWVLKMPELSCKTREPAFVEYLGEGQCPGYLEDEVSLVRKLEVQKVYALFKTNGILEIEE